ncbi:MAG: prepilin-type N-terminal cleavage/methylation domain-containing protein [Planctomycetota bacterium]|nr:prepilin-type N-terminal cleavage/methylation domain-containing protein [Planctomycetota bacterium]
MRVASAERALRHRGFTVLELIVVVAIIGILAGLLLPVLSKARIIAHKKAAESTMHAIVMAFEKYRDDYNAYPDYDKCGDTPVSGDQAGSEVIAYYLCTRFKWGEMHYGPYLDNVNLNNLKDTNGNGIKEFLSPLVREQARKPDMAQGLYRYMLLKDPEGKRPPQFILVDAGEDGYFGGTLDAQQGFVRDGTDANNDGTPDDQDDIFSHAK